MASEPGLIPNCVAVFIQLDDPHRGVGPVKNNQAAVKDLRQPGGAILVVVVVINRAGAGRCSGIVAEWFRSGRQLFQSGVVR